MDSDGTRFAEISETTSFLHYFSGLPDHRQPGKVDYPLTEVLLLILLAILAEADAFTDSRTRSSPSRHVEGAVVTIDAMGCQRDIAAKIVEK
jgi:hypothetical protein